MSTALAELDTAKAELRKAARLAMARGYPIAVIEMAYGMRPILTQHVLPPTKPAAAYNRVRRRNSILKQQHLARCLEVTRQSVIDVDML
jgi:hypothetical protein